MTELITDNDLPHLIQRANRAASAYEWDEAVALTTQALAFPGLTPETEYDLRKGRDVVRYFSWQFVNEKMHLGPRLLLLFVFYGIGLWGMYLQWTKDKKTFLFIFLLFFMTSLAMVTYLNLKLSPSNPNPAHQAARSPGA